MARNHLVTAETENVPPSAPLEKIEPSCRSPLASIPSDHWMPTGRAPFIVIAKSRCDYNDNGIRQAALRALIWNDSACTRNTKLLPHSKQLANLTISTFLYTKKKKTFATPTARLCNRQFMQHNEAFVHFILSPRYVWERWKEVDSARISWPE